MFTNNIIEKRVMAVVKGKIASAQKEYDEGAERLQQTSVEEIKAIETKVKTDKEQLAEDLVNGILNKIL